MSTGSPPARKRLPTRPSEEHLRKQAKRRARVDAVPLALAQHRLAREYGARDWADLLQIVATMRATSPAPSPAGATDEPAAAPPDGDLAAALAAIRRDDADALGAALDRDASLVARSFASLPAVELPGGTLLHVAAERGAGACMRRLLAAGADAAARSATGLTPIACAARGGGPGELRLLLDHGSLGWLADDAGRSPADHARAATSNPHREANVRLLSEVTFDDERFREAVTLLDRGEVEALAALLAAHPHLVTARVEGDSAITRGYFHRPTLLHFVACNPNRGPHMPPRVVEATRVILDAGAAVDATTGHVLGGTTLALVASSQPAHDDGLVAPLLELLVARGADPRHGLRAAILHRYVDTTRRLHALGAAPTAVSAAGVGDLDALRAVLAAGIGDDERLHAGWSAAMNGEADAIDLLADDGLDVSARMPRPFAPTMLHEAAWHGHRVACERLVARGADRAIRDTQFDGTPAGWAREAGHVELATWLDAA